MHYCGILAIAVMATMANCKPVTSKCSGKPADIVFVVDTSTSIWSVDFTTNMLPFITGVVEEFDIGPAAAQTRVAMVTFGNRYYHQFYLDDFTTKKSLTDAINNTPQKGGNTKTHLALDYMTQEMFSPEHGARAGVNHIAVVLTDGKSDNTSLTKTAARAAKEAGVRMFAIGVGSHVGYLELRDIASDPDAKFMFHVGNFRALEGIKEQLVTRTCSVTTAAPPTTPSTATPKPSTTPSTTASTTPATSPTTTTTTSTTTTATPTPTTPTTTSTTAPTTQATSTTEKLPPVTPAGLETNTELPRGDQPSNDKPTDDCKSKPADIYFILDVSASLYVEHFNRKVLPFVSSLVGVFDISPSHTRVGAVTFSENVTDVIQLHQYESREELLKAITSDVIRYTGGRRTNTADAIAYVRDKGFAPTVFRKEATQIVVVITDGISYDPVLTAKEAEKTKKEGIYMFAIGVGPSVDPVEMEAIGSSPSNSFVFHVNHFNALAGIKDALTEETCKIKNSKGFVFDAEDCEIEPTDIMFVFESASKQPSSRSIMRRVITDFAEQLKVKAEHVRVGSLTDPCPAEDDMAFMSLASFRKRVDTIVRNTEGHMHRLLKTLRRKKFTPETSSNGRRQVAVLFLDEQTMNPFLVVREAERLRAQGVEVYVVAVGGVPEFMVAESASNAVKDHVIRLKSYPHLKSAKLNKLWNICAVNDLPSRKPQ